MNFRTQFLTTMGRQALATGFESLKGAGSAMLKAIRTGADSALTSLEESKEGREALEQQRVDEELARSGTAPSADEAALAHVRDSIQRESATAQSTPGGLADSRARLEFVVAGHGSSARPTAPLDAAAVFAARYAASAKAKNLDQLKAIVLGLEPGDPVIAIVIDELISRSIENKRMAPITLMECVKAKPEYFSAEQCQRIQDSNLETMKLIGNALAKSRSTDSGGTTGNTSDASASTATPGETAPGTSASDIPRNSGDGRLVQKTL